MNKAFCFIPAKLASTRLLKKNILKLNGKELISYPIELAKSSGFFNSEDIIVSTESFEVKQIAQKFGAHVPYLRDSKLAVDPYGVVDVLQDFLDLHEAYKAYDHVFILLPTAPLTHLEDLHLAYQKFLENNVSSLMSVVETEHNAFRAVKIQENLIHPLFLEEFDKKSQELEPTYRINGAITIVKVSAFLEQRDYCIHPWGAFVMPKERSVDIDTEEDFKMAKFYSQLNAI